MTRFLAHMKTSRLRPGYDAIRLPGERGCKALRDAEANGIPLDETAIKQLEDIAERNGIPGLLAGAETST